MNSATHPEVFDLAQPVPSGRLAIEASAGTGKTFTLAGLVTLFVAEKAVPISEILVVTFTRAATNELRSRVRHQLVETVALLEQGSSSDPIAARLLDNPDPNHLARLRLAIADFDSATITTIHGFATQVLSTLGVMSGVDPEAKLVDDTDDLTKQTCADVLAAHSAAGVDPEWLPSLSALGEATEKIMKIPGLEIVPDPDDETLDIRARTITSLALESSCRVANRRESSATMSFDDVLVKLRGSLDGPGAEAILDALRHRFSVALIDEFQDTDPVQWQIFHELFGMPGSTTELVLVGDPKQAIYSFRGADIATYLDATHPDNAEVARRSLTTNWRSDGAMLTALEALLSGATFGDPTIGFSPVAPSADHASIRMCDTSGEPIPALSIRLATAPDIKRNTRGIVTDSGRDAVFNDLVGHVGHLLAEAQIPDESDPEASRQVSPSDIAVLVLRRKDAESIRRKLTDNGIPAVLARGSSVLESEASTQWRWLLYAMARPSDPDRARTFALSWFGGHTVDWIRTATDDQIADLQESLRDWADLLAESGLAVAVGHIKQHTEVTARILRHPEGDRQITDLDHVSELLHDAFKAGATSPTALLASLDSEPDTDPDTESDGDITSRRVESEDEAVQILTVWVAKGLEFPIVCAPTLWTDPKAKSAYVYHDPETGRRTFDVASSLGGNWDKPPKAWPNKSATKIRRGIVAEEAAAEHLRLMYVALTRARHHTAVWWSHPNKSSRAGLSRVLFGRVGGVIDLSVALGDAIRLPDDDRLVDALAPLVEQGDGHIEVVVHGAVAPPIPQWRKVKTPTELKPLVLAELGRVPDRHAGRWSFSAIVNQVEYHPDPHDPSMSDRGAADEQASGADLTPTRAANQPTKPAAVSPLATLPAGASFGTLVHEVLEDTDFVSGDLTGDLRSSIARRTRVGSLDLKPISPPGATTADGIDLLIDGLATAIESPLGPLFDGARLSQITRSDRLDEMSFEILLGAETIRPTDRDIGALILDHLPSNDPLRDWAANVADGVFGVELGGHLTGSIDALIRVSPTDGPPRFVVVDYKSNRLHDPAEPPHPGDYSQAAMATAMGHHHYGLQALLYSVAVHRYLRWRLPGYDPAVNLGGAAYLFVRGMAGADVAVHDGIPEGVFTWRIPPTLVVDLSDLLAGGAGVMTIDSHTFRPFIVAGVLSSAEMQLVDTVARLQPDADRLSLLALAVASRGVRLGHACINLREISDLDALLTDEIGSNDTTRSAPPWPDGDKWVTCLHESPIVASPDNYLREPLRPLVLDGDRVYLQRYFSHEIQVATEITRRIAVGQSPEGIGAILDGLFGPDPEGSDPQRRAAETALGGGLTIITGGPGTGKTYTIARILAGATRLADRDGRAIAIALAAPTGKAAGRITESVAEAMVDLPTPPVATTIHALLGWAPGDEFRHNRSNPLPHDLIIIDETSMISLSLMASLLDAVRPDAAVVLVGDPDQLASVEVGTVLSDIVGPAATIQRSESSLAAGIVRLTRSHRFDEGSDIAALAAAVRAGDVGSAVGLLSEGSRRSRDEYPVVEWVRPSQSAAVERVINEVVGDSVAVAEAALAGDAAEAVAASLHTKVLAATRMNQYGLYHWSDLIESSVVARIPGVDNSRRWFVGRPVMITANDRINRVANGDTGIVVARRGGLSVAMAGDSSIGVRYLPTSRLSEVESWWAMTIHKSQGSEFRHVVVSLPPAGSPILTRELLYTAITRAQNRVTIVATEASLREAIGRRVSRASGLAPRLWPDREDADS